MHPYPPRRLETQEEPMKSTPRGHCPFQSASDEAAWEILRKADAVGHGDRGNAS